MNEYLNILEEWSENSDSLAMARVIKTWGSSPRPVGSQMFVNGNGKIAGSVSGGCVEGAVVKKAMEISSGKSSLRLNYGVSDEDAWSVGLSCGGSIQVFLQKIDINKSLVWKTLKNNLKNNKSSILISSLEDGNNTNTLINEDATIIGDSVPKKLVDQAALAYQERTNRTVILEEKEYFIHIFPRKNQLIIVGAAHITVDLVSLANQFGFETIVIDPRGYFTSKTVFKEPPSRIIEKYPSEVLNEFPLDAYTYCAILSHDPKIDDNALEILLPSKVGYIGALGSRKTHEKRRKRLIEKGIDPELIKKIKAPVGLSINAKSAHEIALSVIAEIIQEKNKYLT